MTLYEIGQQIKLHMKAKGIETQQELADQLGLSLDIVNAMINGRKRAGIPAYEKVAEYFDTVFVLRIPVLEGRPGEK